jgi:hypothetical protein
MVGEAVFFVTSPIRGGSWVSCHAYCAKCTIIAGSSKQFIFIIMALHEKNFESKRAGCHSSGSTAMQPSRDWGTTLSHGQQLQTPTSRNH